MAKEKERLLARLCDELAGHSCSRLIAERARLAIDAEHSVILSSGQGVNRISAMLLLGDEDNEDDVTEEYSLAKSASEEMLCSVSVTLRDLVDCEDADGLLVQTKVPQWTKHALTIILPDSVAFQRILQADSLGTFNSFWATQVRFICQCEKLKYESISREKHALGELLTEDDLQHMWRVFQGDSYPNQRFL